MDVKLYNTLTRQTEEFKPVKPGSVSLYTCGPTVYNYPHIGNYRAYLFGDILKRTLLYNGYKVNHIMNLTDVDDKTIRDSQKAGKTLRDFTDFYIAEFNKDRDMLNIIPAAKYTRATDYIDEMVELVEKLLEKGYAYKADDGSTYFKIDAFKDYGKLSHLDRSKLEKNASGRMRADEYDKDNVQDFALWKAWEPTDGDVFWETSLGKGHPGWHIECSAMSMKNLGETVDIHTGGIDNMFPHHENEIAQSECATGKPFVKYWMHNQWLLVDGKKMAKSAGNFYTLRDIIDRGYNPLAFRYLSLQSKYGTPLNFTWESLEAAQTGLKRLYDTARSLSSPARPSINDRGGSARQGRGEVVAKATGGVGELKKQFTEKINNDLDTPAALGLVWTALKEKTIDLETLLEFDKVLGLQIKENLEVKEEVIPTDIQEIISARDTARAAKDWKKSDELRKELEDLGYEVKDTPEGTKVTKK